MKRFVLLLAVVFASIATAQESKSVKIVAGPYLQAVGFTDGDFVELTEKDLW